MWFRFSRPDFFYVGRYRLVDAGDGSPFNRGWSQGFGLFVLNVRWNEGRSESDGIHYPEKPRRLVTINGSKVSLSVDVASYELIVALAGTGKEATVTYHDAAAQTGGSLSPGRRVLLTDGMVFNAVVTGSA